MDQTAKEAVIERFHQASDPERAPQMAAYMKNHFAFLGLPTPLRRKLTKDVVKAFKKADSIDWDFIEHCWALPEREFQYLACDCLRAAQDLLLEDDLERLKKLVITKSWWDSVDSLDKTIGNINFPSPIIDQAMLAWSQEDNIWLRRLAIDHQLLRKEETNTDLLETILVNNLNQEEFFINKAIGWALRDYSKTNPAWVKAFIDRHGQQMTALSIREASKYL